LNIIVCLKSVPGIVTGVAISETKDSLKPTIRSMYMNETDEYALDAALVLRKECKGNVIAVTVGPNTAEEMLQTAVAKGADKAVRIDALSNDAETTSLLLAEAIRRMDFGLILTGLESSDNLAAQVGIATAERLVIPFLFAATKIEINTADKVARVTRESGGGIQEVLKIRLPALIATQTGIQPLTMAPVAKLLQARRRGVDSLSLSSLGMDKTSLQSKIKWEYLKVAKPQKKYAVEPMKGTPKEMAVALMTKMKELL
jgi:electron transfer flavoprotein beta subunit